MSQEFGGVPIALPKSRSIYAVSLAVLLAFLLFYYYYGSLLTILLLFCITSFGFYYLQDMLLYHPDLPANSRIYVPIPKMHNLPHESVSIHTPDKVTLHAFWVSQPKERSKVVPTFVYFHGNAGNMGHRMQNIWGIFNHLHCNILMIDYRGYGFSTGVPSEKGLSLDARAVIDYLYTRNDLDHTKIVLFGRSLGGAVVIDVAADTVYSQKIMCAIVENTFTSIPEMAVELVHPSANLIPKCCFKNKYLSSWKIGKCSVPFLFISGLADNLVPPRMMRTLYMKCGSEQKRILEFIGGAHNDTWIMDGYYQGIHQFLVECRSISTAPLEKPPEKSNVWHEIQDV
ncbi:PREDICTED: protein ABHD13 [Bactrocera latifrons]|uniref:Protein ABHD13 n=1 Tax=Bactrocera latifrons TaxID=174628 RepID=A0A0K8VMQ9_BACLA|nr:PREDICTED: protein ABHD13-like [Bactrocera latifrons]XP_018795089.1 PREDICTED: protein ABHD13 [Bactrocera latifrons]